VWYKKGTGAAITGIMLVDQAVDTQWSTSSPIYLYIYDMCVHTHTHTHTHTHKHTHTHTHTHTLTHERVQKHHRVTSISGMHAAVAGVCP